MQKKYFIMVLISLACVISGFIYLTSRNNTSEGKVISTSSQEIGTEVSYTGEAEPESICVYVCGEVKNKGVYYLNKGDRVSKAIELAGGITENANIDSINLAEIVTDGERIYIPNENETVEQTGESGAGRININRASATELTALPGIGTSRAEQIVAYRENNGNFTEIADIMKVPGIKQAAFDKIKDLICV